MLLDDTMAKISEMFWIINAYKRLQTLTILTLSISNDSEKEEEEDRHNKILKCD